MASALTVTDTQGNEIEIEDQLKTVMAVPTDGIVFSNTWLVSDDRVMGGNSWSHCYLENDYGKMTGIASDVGGGFSICGTQYNYQTDGMGADGEGQIMADLSGYDGLVLE